MSLILFIEQVLNGVQFGLMLFLMAAGDRMTPVGASKGLRAAIKDARSEILPDTGHMIMVERPNETIDILSGFLDDIR